ncbi:MAG: CDP-alcohol phosphatidyltransferase family protein [Clostridia bacterium]|nr:CDP-alcohol phosphatidyltransferase family protein [Clostridia bacterium]
MKKMITVPNCITALRIVGALILLFLTPLSVAFYVVYTLCGVSDVMDGMIARATKTTSEFGAKLDSVADLTFYSVMMLKILPVLWKLLPKWIWIAVAVILAIRLSAYGVAAIRYRKFASLHTYLNKCTGALLFAVPYFLSLSFAVGYCMTVCVVGGLASSEELVMHIAAKKYTTNVKSVVQMLRQS